MCMFYNEWNVIMCFNYEIEWQKLAIHAIIFTLFRRTICNMLHVLFTWFVIVVCGEIFMILLIYKMFNVLVHIMFSKLVWVIILYNNSFYWQHRSEKMGLRCPLLRARSCLSSQLIMLNGRIDNCWDQVLLEAPRFRLNLMMRKNAGSFFLCMVNIHPANFDILM